MDSGDSAGWLSDPLRPSTSSIQAASLCLLAYSCLQDRWDFLDDQFQVSWFPPYREFLFSSGLQWPSCVKEFPSLLQSKKSASYQTLRMWVAGPHRRTPHLGPFVSSSEDSLHHPERTSSSSVRPEGLKLLLVDLSVTLF